MDHGLTADDVLPILMKLPESERARLLDRLLSPGDAWLPEELADLRAWFRLADPEDAGLPDAKGGEAFVWRDGE